ncbi:histidine phosphatase family protein [Treponema medium]|uniref:Phosphoglycerate mutase n=2 Tax=Treponema medium TaxID=58231 RepID=A0AA87NQ65_TREMD|nr:histidine phosphatase family protein [Treponema medium]EPF27952.1 hypothetical protein HMPREF9195_02083 [Treponema medium ATCC 700293]QSH93166.1 histidine phosphatase family protein [Treponema medium]QSH98183.1 histidine phosphatase family protein [Treponema medium]
MLILIRHAHVLFNWEKKYTAEGFAKAQAEYDKAPIEQIRDSQLRSIRDGLPEHFELYTSTLKRSIDTAAQLFPDKTPIQLPELSEIPIYPYRDSDKPLSLWRWLFWGRVQWFCNNPRQERTKQKVEHEIEALMSIFIENKNMVIVGHGFQMRTMLSILARRYPVQKPMHIKNLDRVKCFVYEKDQQCLSFLRTSFSNEKLATV